MKNNLKFDLFNLQIENPPTPNSWIWCKFKSELLKQQYFEMIKKNNQKEISINISKNLGCGRSTIEKYLINLKYSSNTCALPIKIIELLSNHSRYKFPNKHIISLYFTNKNSKKVNALQTITEELCEFVGSFTADGYFNNQDYRINISEGYKDSLIVLQEKIKIIFNYKSKIWLSRKDNTWKLLINNRVICRYFEAILGFKPGKKSTTVRMPELIRNASLKMQKAFVRGFFTFDGGVKTTGNIAFSTMSKCLVNDIEKVLRKDNINYKITYNKNKKAWNLESSSGRNQKLLQKWKRYFFPNTMKYRRIQFFLGEITIKNIDDLERLFFTHWHTQVGLRDLYNTFRKIRKGEVTDIMQELRNRNINVGNTTIYKYLYLLHKANLISKEHYQVKTNKNAFYKTKYLLKESKI